MIGSTTEGYLGDNNYNFVDGKCKNLFEFNLLNSFISKDLQKNELNITDYFINCKDNLIQPRKYSTQNSP